MSGKVRSKAVVVVSSALPSHPCMPRVAEEGGLDSSDDEDYATDVDVVHERGLRRDSGHLCRPGPSTAALTTAAVAAPAAEADEFRKVPVLNDAIASGVLGGVPAPATVDASALARASAHRDDSQAERLTSKGVAGPRQFRVRFDTVQVLHHALSLDGSKLPSDGLAPLGLGVLRYR